MLRRFIPFPFVTLSILGAAAYACRPPSDVSVASLHACLAPEVVGWTWKATETDPVPNYPAPRELPPGMPHVFRLVETRGTTIFGDPMPEESEWKRIVNVVDSETSTRGYQMKIWKAEGDSLHLVWSTGFEWAKGDFARPAIDGTWKGTVRSDTDAVGPGTWVGDAILNQVACPEDF
jgi:hypothetical protein